MRRMLVTAALMLALGGSAARAATASAPLSGVKLLQVTLPSRDLSRSVTFYRDVLGLPLLLEVKGAAFFDVAGVRLRLKASSSTTAQGAELYFDDPGLSKAQALQARGVKFIGEAETVQRSSTTDLKLLEFMDPDGNALALMGEVRR